MSETAAAQLRRILALIPRLADGDDHPVQELAEALGVSREALMDDLASLVERYDLPRGFIEGLQVHIDGTNISATTQHFLRPMRLTMSELCALELGLALARGAGGPDEMAVIDRALARLRSVMSRVPNEDAMSEERAGDLGAAASPEHLRVFRQAIRRRRKVRMSYRKGGATEADDRTICPYSLAFANGAWYAIAHCDRTEGVRFFRLDRVVGLEMLYEGFDVPADFSAKWILRDGRAFSGEADGAVRIRYSPKIARWIAERTGGAVAGDGSVEVTHPMADVSWAVRHVLQYGAEAEVIEPPEVRDELVRVLSAMTEGSTMGVR